MLPTRREILAAAERLPSPPTAIQALWDGDTFGWCLVLSAVVKDGRTWRDHYLCSLRDAGGDGRIFSGAVPPWPESILAIDVGEELAKRFGVPFYFPSPSHPETCPNWWEQDSGDACRRCEILLSKNYDGTVREFCIECALQEERDKRESQWSEEERAGPRCSMCGNPAKPALDSVCNKCNHRHCSRPECGAFCSNCHHYHCGQCGAGMSYMTKNDTTDFDSTPCVICRSSTWLDRLSDSDCEVIHTLFQSNSRHHALQEMAGILQVSFDDLHMFLNEIENGIEARLQSK